MECFAGAAAATGLAASTAFDYNRENFMYDRRQRLHKEFQVQKFRLDQAALWREDVRDLISLTEYKMHVYLLVNVLLLGFTLTIWCEGKLPEGTPYWLMMAHSVSTAGGSMFLLLSIWMAMHAAVAAQGFETRLVTQMVRLPIPSWQEIEASRSYGSQFEKLEPRQMFRIPFLFGRQENLLAENPEEDEESAASSPHLPGHQVLGASIAATSETETPSRAPVFVDPWGLERQEANIPELGCLQGHDVAHLRHISLARQSMLQWQTFDAYARICMSVGVQQLLFAMSYFTIGYVVVEIGCRVAGLYGVFLFTGMADSIIRLDMSLKPWQAILLRCLMLLAPMLSLIAISLWMNGTRSFTISAEFLSAAAFFLHGIALALLHSFSRFQRERVGTHLPAAFKAVLYLDVFDWIEKGEEQELEEEGLVSPGSPSPLHAVPEEPSPVAEEGLRARRPAMEAVEYTNRWDPIPTRPDDFAPLDQDGNPWLNDFRDEPGAPKPVANPHKPRLRRNEDEFYQSSSWLAGEDGGAYDAVSGLFHILDPHAKRVDPTSVRVLPWLVFRSSIGTLSAVWILAGLYHTANGLAMLSMNAEITFEASAPLITGNGTNASFDISELGNESLGPLGLVFTDLANEPLTGGGFSSHRMQELDVSWPHPNVLPKGLSCDVKGHVLVATDGISIYASRLQEEKKEDMIVDHIPLPFRVYERVPEARFHQASCSSVLGENIQDTSIECKSKAKHACHLLVLHRNGQQIASCALNHREGQLTEMNVSATISGQWLERLRLPGSATALTQSSREVVPHARVEFVVAMTRDTSCRRHDGPGSCVVLGTSRGRVARLEKQRGSGHVLRPVQSLRDHPETPEESWGPGAVRRLNHHFLGVLDEGRNSISLLDARGGKPVGRMELPLRAWGSNGFCAGGGHLFLLGPGPSPPIWRLPLPSRLKGTGLL